MYKCIFIDYHKGTRTYTVTARANDYKDIEIGEYESNEEAVNAAFIARMDAIPDNAERKNCIIYGWRGWSISFLPRRHGDAKQPFKP